MNAIVQLKSGVAKMQGEFAKALPSYITSERFVRTAQTAISLTRNIERVRNPQSLMAACAKAAADGLILDGREAALVVDHKGDVQYRPMMRGLLKLAHNSGQIKSLVVEPVHEADDFDYEPTRSGQPIVHKIDLRKPRGEIFAVYALATLIDGGVQHEVMSAAEVNEIRNRSDAWKAFKAGKIKGTPWHSDWSEMARKTVFRRLSKYLPSSSDRDTLHQAAERIDDDYITIDHEAFAADNPDQQKLPAPKKRGGAAAALSKPSARNSSKPAERKPEPEPQAEIDPDTGELTYERDEFPEMQPGDDI